MRSAQKSQVGLLAEAKASVSASKKQANLRRVTTIQASLNKAIIVVGRASVDPKFAAALNKHAEQYGGNPQSLVDFEDVYEQGDPDGNLYQQSQPGSPTEPPVGVGEGDKVAHEEKADDNPVPQYGETLSALRKGVWSGAGKTRTFTAGNIKLAGSEASDMLDKIQVHMGAGLSYEAAETKVLEELAVRIAHVKNPKLTGSRADLMARLQATAESDEDEENGDEDDMEGKEASRSRTARPGSDYTGEDPRGGGKENPEGKLQSGNSDTLASPATSGVVGDPGEMLRSSDPPAKRPVQPVEGTRRTAEDIENRLDVGTGDTLGSPSTVDVSGDANAYEGDKAAMDQQGNSVDAPETTLSTRDAVFARMAEENKRLKSEVRKNARKTRQRKASRIVQAMTTKGLFKQFGNQLRQRDAAQKEYQRLCKLPTIAFVEAERQVKEAREGTRVPREWTRAVPIQAREGSVRVAVNQTRRQSDSDAESLGTMFMPEERS